MKYSITENDFVKAQRLHNNLLKYLFIFSVITLVNLVYVYNSSINKIPIIFIIAIISMSITCIEYSPLVLFFSYKRNYRTQKSLHEEFTLTFDKEKFSIESESDSFHSRWNDIYKYKIGKNIILLYESKKIMRIIVFNNAQMSLHSELSEFL